MKCMRCGWATHADANDPWWNRSFCQFCVDFVLQNWIMNGAPNPTTACQHGAWVWDLKEGVSWDLNARHMFGQTPNSPISRATFEDAVHPDDRERIEYARRHAIEHQGLYEVQYRIWTPGGDLRRIQSTARGYYDRSGQPLYMMGICFDVTPHEHRPNNRKDNYRT